MERVHGRQLLNFFLNHGYIIDEDFYGQASMCPADNPDPLGDFFNIPYQQYIGWGFIERTLEKRGFSVEEFEDWVEKHA